MILFLIFLVFLSPMQEVENLHLALPAHQQEIFLEYSNANFSQTLQFSRRYIKARIMSFNYLDVDFNYRVMYNPDYVAQLPPEVQTVVKRFFDDSQSLKNFMTLVSSFLESNIRYSEELLPQDAASVLFNRRANCVGYSNLVEVFLNAASIESHQVKGFYLERTGTNTWTPIPHRWLEIYLPDGMRFFYDPQYQDFSANYITTRDDIDFKKVRRFKVWVLKTSKKIIN